jgi:hypothetical protein
MRLLRGAACVGLAFAIACDGAEDRQAEGEDSTVFAAPPPGGGVNASAEPTQDTAAAPVAPAPTPSPPARRPATPGAAADTARGTVQLVGTALEQRVVVATSGGQLGIAGPLAPMIERLQGMELWVQGPITALEGRSIPRRQISPERFEVRGVAGVPAIDGTLRDDAGVYLVVSNTNDRTRLTTVPDGLRALVGKRVWVTRAPDGGVAAFGEITGG